MRSLENLGVVHDPYCNIFLKVLIEHTTPRYTPTQILKISSNIKEWTTSLHVKNLWVLVICRRCLIEQRWSDMISWWSTAFSCSSCLWLYTNLNNAKLDKVPVYEPNDNKAKKHKKCKKSKKRLSLDLSQYLGMYINYKLYTRVFHPNCS